MRLVEEGDIQELHALSKVIGWGGTIQEWRDDVLFAKESSFVVLQDKKIVGVGLGLPFDSIARVASVIIHPEHQCRGLGTRLVANIVKRLTELGCNSVALEASEQGQPVYTRIGFKASSSTVTFSKEIKESQHVGYTLCEKEDLDRVEALDKEVFGASRRQLIEREFERGRILVSKIKSVTGFLLYSEEESAIRIGPWVHEDATEAKKLMQSAMDLISQTYQNKKEIVIHVSKMNRVALEILQDLGFNKKFKSMHMEFGDSLPTSQKDKGYAIWSLGAG